MNKVRLVEYAPHNWVTHAGFENVEFRIKDKINQFRVFGIDKPRFSARVQIAVYGMEESL